MVHWPKRKCWLLPSWDILILMHVASLLLFNLYLLIYFYISWSTHLWIIHLSICPSSCPYSGMNHKTMRQPNISLPPPSLPCNMIPFGRIHTPNVQKTIFVITAWWFDENWTTWCSRTKHPDPSIPLTYAWIFCLDRSWGGPCLGPSHGAGDIQPIPIFMINIQNSPSHVCPAKETTLGYNGNFLPCTNSCYRGLTLGHPDQKHNQGKRIKSPPPPLTQPGWGLGIYYLGEKTHPCKDKWCAQGYICEVWITIP